MSEVDDLLKLADSLIRDKRKKANLAFTDKRPEKYNPKPTGRAENHNYTLTDKIGWLYNPVMEIKHAGNEMIGHHVLHCFNSTPPVGFKGTVVKHNHSQHEYCSRGKGCYIET